MTSTNIQYNLPKGFLDQIIGSTPLILIKNLSKITGCEIYGKAEFLNPGGSVKDRTALGMILDAEKSGKIQPGFTLVEGTAGNTGIGLALLASQRGYKVKIVMPNNLSIDKFKILEILGAEVISVEPTTFDNPKHYYHTAKRIASENPNHCWMDQFENLANYKIHYHTTGPEIWKQCNQHLDYFITSSGTGGTIAGVSKYLKEKDKNIKVILADPDGSALFQHFKTGSLSASGSSFTEGIGIMRITGNYKQAVIDDAIQIHDQEMVEMMYYLTQKEGLLIGTSGALNVMAAYKFAKKNPGKKIVTMLCDGALRYQSRFFNLEWLKEKNLVGKCLDV